MSQIDVSSGLRSLEQRIATLAADVRRGQRVRLATWRPRIVGNRYRGSATNLAAYLTFRHHDIRSIQDELSVLGLSSLGRTESHVRAGIAAVEAALIALQGDAASLSRLARIARLRAAQGRVLTDRTALLLGPEPTDRRTRIMVTMPATAATDPQLVRDLIDRGMDLARINGAHDGPDTWRGLARHIRAASRDAGRPCRILLDLPGPKLRIGPLPGRPGRLHLRSPSDERGPSSVILDGTVARGTSLPLDGIEPLVAVDPTWVERLKSGDRISCIDARGRARVLLVHDRTPSGGVRASSVRSLVLIEGTVLHLARKHGGKATTRIGPLQPTPRTITVRVGDRVWLVSGASTGSASIAHDEDEDDEPWIACAEPGIMDALAVGHQVIVDDGHIVTMVETIGAGGALLRVVSTRRPEERLREDQGLNFPDSPIRGQGFGVDDLLALDIAAEVADIVGLSFAQTPDDVDRLIAELDARGASGMGVIAKIETQLGIKSLPQIIVAGATRRPFGVMIARGDLAVEIGYERTAEMQEEILWLCEAAHVPVVWATQVLESLVKTGIPTRAELTDAAMAQRAECVMLNKGPHILEGMDTLVDVIGRMQAHQSKKMSWLRALESW